MRTAHVLLALCAALPAVASAQDADRAALLRGVSEVTAPGCIPGDFAVFGQQAFVAMTGKMGTARLPVLAGARYGRGRAVGAGHEGFFGAASLRNEGNRRLAEDVAAWTSGGKALAGLRVGLIDQDAALADVLSAAGCRPALMGAGDLPARLAGIDVLWLNQASLDGAANAARARAVRDWVRQGGGVVLAGPAWGWESLNPGRDLARDHSGNQILMPMGMAFCGAMLEGSGQQGFVPDASGPGLTSVRLAFAALSDHAAGRRALSAADIEQVTATLTQAVRVLPDAPGGVIRRVRALCARQAGEIAPTHEKPVTLAMPFARLRAVLDMEELRRLPADRVRAHPASASFPGAIPAGAPRQTRTVEIDTRRPAWHGTGLYAAPGEVVTVTVPSSAAGKGLRIRIGAHTDTLWHLPRWERFPEVTMSRPLDAHTTRVASPLGGLVFVDVPEECTLGTLSITVAHAVAAPRFVRGVTSLAEWRQTVRQAPGPWADLEGRLVALTVPSSVVRDLDDPEALMAYWDEVAERCSELYAAPPRPRPERYCVDRQISAGYMHSGYPMMTFEDVARTFCDLKVLRGHDGLKLWGFYHELGHNFQQGDWTWDGMGEVTNNLFSLYGAETINGVTVGAHPAMTEAEIAKRVQVVSAAPGAEAYYLKDPWYPLTMLLLLRRAFGWEPFTRVFAEFGALPPGEHPRTDQEKRDQFLVRFSKAVGRDLSGYLAAWGVKASAEARESLKALPAWMPDGMRRG